MAGTIKFNYDIQITNGNSVLGPTYVRKEIVQNNPGGPNGGTVTATTSGITVSHGLSTLGVCEVTNLDATNFVTVGPVVTGTQHDLIKLKPGETWPFRLVPGVTVGVKADAASCKVTFKIYED